jgi:hypothetical protein
MLPTLIADRSWSADRTGPQSIACARASVDADLHCELEAMIPACVAMRGR